MEIIDGARRTLLIGCAGQNLQLQAYSLKEQFWTDSRIGGNERYSVSERTEKWVEEDRNKRFTTASSSWGTGRRRVLLDDAAFFLALSFLPLFLFEFPLIENRRVRNPMSAARACVLQVSRVGCLRLVSRLWESCQSYCSL